MKTVAACCVLAGFAGIAAALVRVAPSPAEKRFGEIVHETRSDFSHIRVRDLGSVRSLLFVAENGEEHCQSAIDRSSPATLRHGYAKALFGSFLIRYPQERVLIIGLGGGGMVRFLNAKFPSTLVEAVEIDPAVVEIAGTFFGTVAGPKTRLHTADAFEFFDTDRGAFDAIYCDAFLRAPVESGLGEKTRRLKTREFLETLRHHLVPGGVVAFNLIEADPRTPDDIAAIGEVFGEVLRFGVPGTGNLAVIAPREGPAPPREALRERAAELDRALDPGFSFLDLIDPLRR